MVCSIVEISQHLVHLHLHVEILFHRLEIVFHRFMITFHRFKILFHRFKIRFHRFKILFDGFKILFLRFADTDYWLEYFPPKAHSDLQRMGLKVIIISFELYVIFVIHTSIFIYLLLDSQLCKLEYSSRIILLT